MAVYDLALVYNNVYIEPMFTLSPKSRTGIMIVPALIMLAIFASALVFIIWTKSVVLNSDTNKDSSRNTASNDTLAPSRFPVSVDSNKKLIYENPNVDIYVEPYLTIKSNWNISSFTDSLLAVVAQFDWYQNLASSVSRILVIYPGERKEEIVKNFGDILKWSTEERNIFSEYITKSEPFLEEGTFFPGRYIVPYDATPENVADLLTERFANEVLNRYDSTVSELVPLEEALTIASLLEREAYDFSDMRYISGIIWNRLFVDMPLQLDATLQYARGNSLSERVWWPKVVPADKYIESPFNTYQNEGLPPAPIANPSLEAIIAALNPEITDCMFYFHGPKGQFYCTESYEEHVEKLKEVYGRGK